MCSWCDTGQDKERWEEEQLQNQNFFEAASNFILCLQLLQA